MKYLDKEIEIPARVNRWWLFGQVMNEIHKSWYNNYGHETRSHGHMPDEKLLSYYLYSVLFKEADDFSKAAWEKIEDDRLAEWTDAQILGALRTEERCLEETIYKSLDYSMQEERLRIRKSYCPHHRAAKIRGIA